MKFFCSHMAKQISSGYARKICKGCPARGKILANRANAQIAKGVKGAKAS